MCVCDFFDVAVLVFEFGPLADTVFDADADPETVGVFVIQIERVIVFEPATVKETLIDAVPDTETVDVLLLDDVLVFEPVEVLLTVPVGVAV